MARADIDKTIIIKTAAEMANEVGLEKVTLKLLANQLNIKPPSLYNHIKGLDDLRKEVMIFGWKQLEERVIEAAICVTGYDALEAMGRTFYKTRQRIPAFLTQCSGIISFKATRCRTLQKDFFLLFIRFFPH